MYRKSISVSNMSIISLIALLVLVEVAMKKVLSLIKTWEHDSKVLAPLLFSPRGYWCCGSTWVAVVTSARTKLASASSTAVGAKVDLGRVVGC